MRTLTKLILTCGVLAVGLLQASATLTLRLSADGGQTWVSVVDGGPLDSNPTTGIVQFSGPVGSWFVDINTGFGSPLLGSSINPVMDLGTTSSSSDSANLIVQLSDTGFTPFPNETFILQSGGFAGGSVVYTAYRDSGNVQFGTTATYTGDPAGISPSPTASILSSISAVSGNYQASNTVVVANGTGPFSLTLETVLVHNSATHSSTDSSLTVLPPPPCNCTLTFTSPQFITNCVGDAIPNVTASEDCGSGPVSVPVAFVSASTNGVCPQIITRNFTATDDCSTVHPFSQTITVNCLPDCTITTSVSSTTVGTTNLHAWVAGAGPGATYAWNVINGTITAGQGTTNITFTAGSDASNPVSITVKIINANGCQNNCTAGIRNGPPLPACIINGVTISDTSWNQFNVPNNTSPSVWVHAHLNGIKGVPKTGVTTVQFTGVSLTLGGTAYALPDGVMIFDSSAPATPSTTFSGGKWTTTFNPNNLSDEMFFTGAAIPVTPAIAAGTKATLTYTTLASVQGLSFSWQWSAAVFTYWPTDWNQAMILPYHKADHAGTPENTTVQKSLIQGPRGGGGSNFTGSWSATGSAACQ